MNKNLTSSEPCYFRNKNLSKCLRALKEYHPEKIILFGSYVQGGEDEYSDLDLVVIKKTRKRFLNRLKEVMMLIKPTFALDILVYTPRELEKLIEEGNPFIEQVMEKGRVIYEKS